MPEGFPRITGVAAPLLQDNIDTDTIAPGSRAVKGESANGEFQEKGSSHLARDLFANWRYGEDGREIPTFVLNQPGFREARILIAGANFGCGSSRESAVWMLKEFGIRCVIAPSFGEIFWGNCFKNSVLPVILPGNQVRALAEEAQPHSSFIVDLTRNEILAPSGKAVRFELPEFRRRGLLEGRDEIDVTLEMEPRIAAFLERAAEVSPWAYRLPK